MKLLVVREYDQQHFTFNKSTFSLLFAEVSTTTCRLSFNGGARRNLKLITNQISLNPLLRNLFLTKNIMATKKNPVVHFEMPYKDSSRVSKFYAQAFGWDMNNLGPQMSDYVIATTTEIDANNMITTPGHINGGFYPLSQETSGYPSVVIAVENIRGAMQRIKDAGGQLLGEPVTIPGIGEYVSFTDSEGNRVSILQPSER